MKRFHVLLLALLLGASAVAATFAVVETTNLGMSAKAKSVEITNSQLAARNGHLDNVEAAVKRALRRKPPALPQLPKRHAPQAHVVHVVSSAPPAQTIAAAPAPAAAPASTSSGTSGSGSGSTSDDGGSNHESEPEPEEGDDGP